MVDGAGGCCQRRCAVDSKGYRSLGSRLVKPLLVAHPSAALRTAADNLTDKASA
jgi:hypothetical protein